MSPLPTILDPAGRDVMPEIAADRKRARAAAKKCPVCASGPDRRQASCGFGTEITALCSLCGHDFKEPFHER